MCAYKWIDWSCVLNDVEFAVRIYRRVYRLCCIVVITVIWKLVRFSAVKCPCSAYASLSLVQKWQHIIFPTTFYSFSWDVALWFSGQMLINDRMPRSRHIYNVSTIVLHSQSIQVCWCVRAYVSLLSQVSWLIFLTLLQHTRYVEY